ncbi:MAG: LacI family DNA-binding transcriptional regulator, partial [Actinobacteria bacterium]|nr:LacI family DNA-binding transcriptional regulator [Actinomycetota bacterium]
MAAKNPVRGTRVGVTLVDVAREAGVDQSTVSRVLRDDHRAKATDETRARIREVAARLGYVPNATARSLAMRRTSTIALLIPQVSGFIYADIIKGAGDEARRLGYVLVVADGSEMGRANDAIRTLVLEGRVDGLLLASGT